MSEFPYVPVAALLIPIVVVPFSLLFKYLTHERRMEHAERLKALEMGRTLPQDESWWSPSRVAVAIGAGVPVLSMLIALSSWEMVGFHEEVWGISGAVALAGVGCGTFLANKHFNHKANMELAALNGDRFASNGKPAFDPDAYDTAGRRG